MDLFDDGMSPTSVGREDLLAVLDRYGCLDIVPKEFHDLLDGWTFAWESKRSWLGCTAIEQHTVHVRACLVNDPALLRHTLLHEIAHAVTWMEDPNDGPFDSMEHGERWAEWCRDFGVPDDATAPLGIMRRVAQLEVPCPQGQLVMHALPTPFEDDLDTSGEGAGDGPCCGTLAVNDHIINPPEPEEDETASDPHGFADGLYNVDEGEEVLEDDDDFEIPTSWNR